MLTFFELKMPCELLKIFSEDGLFPSKHMSLNILIWSFYGFLMTKPPYNMQKMLWLSRYHQNVYKRFWTRLLTMFEKPLCRRFEDVLQMFCRNLHTIFCRDIISWSTLRKSTNIRLIFIYLYHLF